MPHVLQCSHFPAYLLLAQLAPRDVSVLCMVRAIDTAVDAPVRKVQRGKHDYPVAVKSLLYLLCQGEYPFYKVRVIAFHQYRRLPVVQSFKFCGLVYDGPDHFPVVLVGGGECHRLPDLVVVYEFFRFCGISNILLSVHSGLVNLYQIYTFLISSQIYSDDMCRPACRSSSPRGVVASVDGNLIADASERCFQVRQPLG